MFLDNFIYEKWDNFTFLKKYFSINIIKYIRHDKIVSLIKCKKHIKIKKNILKIIITLTNNKLSHHLFSIIQFSIKNLKLEPHP